MNVMKIAAAAALFTVATAGAAFAPWTAPIMRFIAQNMLVATLICSTLVIIYALRKRR